MKIKEITPDWLKEVDDKELLNLHRRCHQLYPQIKEEGGEEINLEDLVNAHHLIVAEMQRRGMEHNEHDGLDKELKEKSNIPISLDDLPEKIIIVPDFIELVGSAVRREDYNDLDILVRANLEGDAYQLKFENVYVPIRLTLDPDKEIPIHLINNPQGAFTNHLPLYDLALVRSETRDVQRLNPFWKARKSISSMINKFKKSLPKLTKGKWEPITYSFQTSKPRMGLYHAGTEAFKPEELQDWLKKHPEAVAENKLNGFRAILQKKKDKVSLYFEDAKKERSKQIPNIPYSAKKIPADFILDGDIGVVEAGKRWPRVRIMALTGKEVTLPDDAYPIFTAFDIIYWDEKGGDLHEKPFRERRKLLEEFYNKYLKDNKFFDLSTQMKVRNLTDLEKAWDKLANMDMSEGIVLKDETAPYIEGASDVLAKIKHVVELKVIVIESRRNKNGTYSFRCGLLPGSLNFQNTVEFKGETYVDMKLTMNAIFQAKPGDIITVQPQEIIIRETKGGEELSWTAAVPVDVDKTREEPYTAGQAIDLAERAGILNDARSQPKKQKQIREKAIQKILKADWTFDQNKLEFLESYEPVSEEAKLYKKLYTRLAKDKKARHRMKHIMKFNYDLFGPDAIVELSDESEGGETRGERAAKYWAENWWKNYPESGKGEFVAQHHWRGLSKEETKLSHEELLETGHSVHADLRFTANDHLWGFTVFLGEPKENKKAGGSQLLLLQKPDRKLEGQFKLPQPKEWLQVGVGKPYVAEPLEVGSTSKKYSKFFLFDRGSYEMGVWREHAFEVFLHGEKLKGRYIIQYAELEGRGRVWLIDKPADETPYADKHKLEDVVKELKKKGQKYLIWAKPGKRPELIEVDKFEIEKRSKTNNKKFIAPIIKVDEEKRFALAPALVPNKIDKDGEFITAEEIEETAHDFMAWYQMVTYMHEIPIEKKDIAIVESYILRQPLKAGGVELPEGTWMLGFKIYDDSLWEEVKKGKIKGISIGGYCMGCNPKPKFAIEKSQKKTKESGDDEEPRELKNLKVFEVALVDNPAVPDAQWLILKRDKDEVRNVPEKKEKQAAGGVDALKLLQEAMKLIEQVMAQVESAVMGYAYAPPEKKGAKKEEKQGGKALEDALKEIVESEDAPKEVKEAAKKILEFLRGGDAYPAPKKEEEEEKATEAKEEKQPKAPEKTEKQEKPKPKENLDKIVTKQIEKAMKKLDKKIGKIREEIEEVEKKFLATGETQKLKETTREEGAEDFYAKIGRDPFGRRLKKQ